MPRWPATNRSPPRSADYGEAIGLAFQLRDDLLGVFGAEHDTGKPVGDDLSEGKPTTLLAIATRRAAAPQLAVLDHVGHECSPQQVADIQTVLEETGARSEVERLTLELTHQGVSAITRAKARGELDPHAADVLAEFAVILCDRTS